MSKSDVDMMQLWIMVMLGLFMNSERRTLLINSGSVSIFIYGITSFR